MSRQPSCWYLVISPNSSQPFFPGCSLHLSLPPQSKRLPAHHTLRVLAFSSSAYSLTLHTCLSTLNGHNLQRSIIKSLFSSPMDLFLILQPLHRLCFSPSQQSWNFLPSCASCQNLSWNCPCFAHIPLLTIVKGEKMGVEVMLPLLKKKQHAPNGVTYDKPHVSESRL